LWRYQNWSSSDGYLQHVEGFVLLLVPSPHLVCFDKVKEGPGYCREISNKSPVEVDKTQEGLDISLVLRGGPVSHFSYLDRIYGDLIYGYH